MNKTLLRQALKFKDNTPTYSQTKQLNEAVKAYEKEHEKVFTHIRYGQRSKILNWEAFFAFLSEVANDGKEISSFDDIERLLSVSQSRQENIENTGDSKSRYIAVFDGVVIFKHGEEEPKLYKDPKTIVIDVGGNKTTTIILEGLKKTRLYRKIDLFIIPMSGGYQDLKNAEKTYEMIKGFGVPVIFALSRVRNPKRLQFQYGDFFKAFPDAEYLILSESDVIDLSRQRGKSVYEISHDEEEKMILENALDKAFDVDDNLRIGQISTLLQIYDESEAYVEKILSPAFEVIEQKVTDGCQA